MQPVRQPTEDRAEGRVSAVSRRFDGSYSGCNDVQCRRGGSKDGVDQKPLTRESLVLIASVKMFPSGVVLKVADLLPLSFILPSTRSSIRQRIDELFERERAKPNIVLLRD